jgi:hypothetical protein
MAGFLDKKRRLIDYKLTEYGREKLSKGDLSFKFFTFSDKSLFYDSNLTSEYDFKTSSLESFMPFEARFSEGNIINPEFVLSNTIKFESKSRSKLYTVQSSDRTVAEIISDQQFLDDRDVDNKSQHDEILFDRVFRKSIYDFKNNEFILQYPTIKFPVESIVNIPSIKKDYRFRHFTRNKKLVPISKSGVSVNLGQEEDFNSLEYLFKNLEIENLDINSLKDREKVINVIIRELSKDKGSIFKLEYEFLQDNAKETDEYLFELHSIKDNNLSKLVFVNLGEFIDSIEQDQFTVYLIGKVVRTINEKENFNKENRTLIFDLNKDYVFLNIFTMVIR